MNTASLLPRQRTAGPPARSAAGRRRAGWQHRSTWFSSLGEVSAKAET